MNAETEPTVRTARHWERRLIIGGVIAVALLTLLFGTAAIVQAAYRGKVLPRTIVAGAALTGQSVASATAILTEDAARLQNTQLTLTLGSNQQSLTAKDLGVSLNVPATVQAITAPRGTWSWLTPSYWQTFFAVKKPVLDFSQAPSELQQTLSQQFALIGTPKDAGITVVNGSLTVTGGAPGATVNVTNIPTAVADFFATGQAARIVLHDAAQTPPTVNTVQATAVINQIGQTLRPLTLTYGGKNYAVPVSDQYTLLDYSTTGGTLQWHIDPTKLQTYLQNQIAKKINTSMIPQVTETGTNQHLSTGRDGVQVDITALTQAVTQAMTTPSVSATVAVSAAVTPFSQQVAAAGDAPNLFPGLYIDINLKLQRLYIMEGDAVTNEFLISSGEANLPTPTGQFYICAKNPEARSTLYNDLWMPDWNALSTSPDSCSGYAGYGIHALPCFDKSCTEVEDANHLGTPISHGCVRLSDTNAVWFYQNIPIGTPINIHR